MFGHVPKNCIAQKIFHDLTNKLFKPRPRLNFWITFGAFLACSKKILHIIASNFLFLLKIKNFKTLFGQKGRQNSEKILIQHGYWVNMGELHDFQIRWLVVTWSVIHKILQIHGAWKIWHHKLMVNTNYAMSESRVTLRLFKHQDI